jgi:tryptophan-rich sensory protein
MPAGTVREETEVGAEAAAGQKERRRRNKLRKNPLVPLVGYLAAVFIVASLSGAMTSTQITGWYSGLVKPAFNPPNAIFGPVWTALYVLMALAAFRVSMVTAVGEQHAGWPARQSALLFWWVQLGLNFAWSVIFFHMHRIGGALVDVVLLLGAVTVVTVMFWRISRTAGLMVLPYLLWTAFALVLNLRIYQLN